MLSQGRILHQRGLCPQISRLSCHEDPHLPYRVGVCAECVGRRNVSVMLQGAFKKLASLETTFASINSHEYGLHRVSSEMPPGYEEVQN